MPRHDAVDLHGDSSAEGNKFKLIKASAVGTNHREIDVRVGGCVAVAWEMFGRRQSAIFPHAANKLRNKFRYARRIFSKRSCVDDRISGIIVYIRVRRIDPVNSDGARFERRDFAHRVRVLRIAAGGECHGRWKRRAFIQPHRCTAFEIRADQQRQFRLCLELVVQYRRGISLALHDAQRRSLRNVDEPSHVEIGHVVHDLPVGRRVRGRKTSVISCEKKLPNLFVDTHLAQRVFHPDVRGGRQFFHPALYGNCTLLDDVFFCRSAAALAACVIGHKENY